MKLTDIIIKKTAPGKKPVYLFDGRGLYLTITPAGGKLWRMKYRFDGKEKLLSFGAYPDVSLADARTRRDEAKKLLANGTDPGAVKQAQKAAKQAKQERAANSFKVVAEKWFKTWQGKVTGAVASRQWSNLERHIFPVIGSMPITNITRKTVIHVLREVEARGISDTVRKARTAINQIMEKAMDDELIEHNPVPSLDRILTNKASVKHMPAITDPVKVGALLRAIDGYQGQPEVNAALKLLPLVFVRPGELRTAKWADIDLDKGEWRYTASKTKTPHLVPLATQAVEILRDLQALTGGGDLVFPGLNSRDKQISNSTINAALRRMGYCTKTEHTAHGFRATARTLLEEELGFKREEIDHQLAHSVPDALGRAYNRTEYKKARRAMMQQWADYLDRLREGAQVIPLRA